MAGQLQEIRVCVQGTTKVDFYPVNLDDTTQKLLQTVCVKTGNLPVEAYVFEVDVQRSEKKNLPEWVRGQKKIQKLEKKWQSDVGNHEANRQRLNLDDPLVDQGVDPAEHILILRPKGEDDTDTYADYAAAYNEAIGWFKKPSSACPLEEACTLASLQACIDHDLMSKAVKQSSIEKHVKSCLPKYLQSNKAALRRALEKNVEHRTMATGAIFNLAFTTCTSMPAYKAELFIIKRPHEVKKKLVPTILGVSESAIIIIDDKTKEVLELYPLEHIAQFSFTQTKGLLGVRLVSGKELVFVSDNSKLLHTKIMRARHRMESNLWRIRRTSASDVSQCSSPASSVGTPTNVYSGSPTGVHSNIHSPLNTYSEIAAAAYEDIDYDHEPVKYKDVEIASPFSGEIHKGEQMRQGSVHCVADGTVPIYEEVAYTDDSKLARGPKASENDYLIPNDKHQKASGDLLPEPDKIAREYATLEPPQESHDVLAEASGASKTDVTVRKHSRPLPAIHLPEEFQDLTDNIPGESDLPFYAELESPPEVNHMLAETTGGGSGEESSGDCLDEVTETKPHMKEERITSLRASLLAQAVAPDEDSGHIVQEDYLDILTPRRSVSVGEYPAAEQPHWSNHRPNALSKEYMVVISGEESEDTVFDKARAKRPLPRTARSHSEGDVQYVHGQIFPTQPVRSNWHGLKVPCPHVPLRSPASSAHQVDKCSEQRSRSDDGTCTVPTGSTTSSPGMLSYMRSHTSVSVGSNFSGSSSVIGDTAAGGNEDMQNCKFPDTLSSAPGAMAMDITARRHSQPLPSFCKLDKEDSDDSDDCDDFEYFDLPRRTKDHDSKRTSRQSEVLPHNTQPELSEPGSVESKLYGQKMSARKAEHLDRLLHPIKQKSKSKYPDETEVTKLEEPNDYLVIASGEETDDSTREDISTQPFSQENSTLDLVDSVRSSDRKSLSAAPPVPPRPVSASNSPTKACVVRKSRPTPSPKPRQRTHVKAEGVQG